MERSRSTESLRATQSSLVIQEVVDESADDDQHQQNPEPSQAAATWLDANFGHAVSPAGWTLACERRVREISANRTPARLQRVVRATPSPLAGQVREQPR